MAITLTSNDLDRAGFDANGVSSDLSGCETLVAAVSGKSVYLQTLDINNRSSSALSITVGANESSSAVATAVCGPWLVNAKSTVSLDFAIHPVKLAASAALTADASAGGAVTLHVAGYIK